MLGRLIVHSFNTRFVQGNLCPSEFCTQKYAKPVERGESVTNYHSFCTNLIKTFLSVAFFRRSKMSRRHETSAHSSRARKRIRVSTRDSSASQSPPPRRRFQTSSDDEWSPQVHHHFEKHEKLLKDLQRAYKGVSRSAVRISSSEARIRLGGLETVWKDLKRAASYVANNFSGARTDQVHLDQVRAKTLYQATRVVLQQAMINTEPSSPWIESNESTIVPHTNTEPLELPTIYDVPTSSSAPTSATANASRDGQSIIRVEVQAPHPDEGKVGTFAGDYSKWLAFKSRFLAGVHDNQRFKPAQKLRRLKEALQGRASISIGDWDESERGYEDAWAKLCRVYDNELLIMRDHIHDIFKLTKTEPATRNSVQELADTVANADRQLRRMNANVGEALLIVFTEDRMDLPTRTAWEMLQGTGRMPTLEQLTNFLEIRARILINADSPAATVAIPNVTATVSSGTLTATSVKQPVETSTAQFSNRRIRSMNRFSNNRSGGTGTRRSFPPCNMCRSTDHGLWRCPAFSVLPLPQMTKLIKDWKLCNNCLGEFHELAKCKLGPCKRCPQQYHNTVICPVAKMSSHVAALLGQMPPQWLDQGDPTLQNTQ